MIERITVAFPVYTPATRGGNTSTLAGMRFKFGVTNHSQAVVFTSYLARTLFGGRPRDYLREVQSASLLEFYSVYAEPGWAEIHDMEYSPWIEGFGSSYFYKTADPVYSMGFNLYFLEYGTDVLWEKLEEVWQDRFGKKDHAPRREEVYRRHLDL